MTGLPDPQRRHPRRRNAGEVLLRSVKPFFFEDAGQVLRRLEFLEAELAEAEDLIVHLLDVFAHAVDFEADIALVLIELGVGGGAGRAPAPARAAAAGAAVNETVTTIAHAIGQQSGNTHEGLQDAAIVAHV